MAKTKTQDQKLIEKVAAIAAEKALEFLNKEKQNQQNQKRDRRLRNTKLLLRNYRKFKAHCQDSIEGLEELKDKDSLEYLDTDDLVIESIIRNKERTLVMLAYIDRMIQVYQILSEKSDKPEDLRQYKVLYDLYISEDEKTIEEIAKGNFMNKRTVYKDINKACEALSSLIFGVDGLRMT
jgi:hypothetical protein